MKKKRAPQKRISKKSVRPSDPRDQCLREHLLYLLRDGGAHIGFDGAMGDWPVRLAGVRVANFPHTAWMLLEHIRLAQWDILEFSRNPKHVSPAWPQGYWPPAGSPPSASAWNKSLRQVRADLKAM